MICQILRAPAAWLGPECLPWSFQTQRGLEKIPGYAASGLCAQIAQSAMTCVLKTSMIYFWCITNI